MRMEQNWGSTYSCTCFAEMEFAEMDFVVVVVAAMSSMPSQVIRLTD